MVNLENKAKEEIESLEKIISQLKEENIKLKEENAELSKKVDGLKIINKIKKWKKKHKLSRREISKIKAFSINILFLILFIILVKGAIEYGRKQNVENPGCIKCLQCGTVINTNCIDKEYCYVCGTKITLDSIILNKENVCNICFESLDTEYHNIDGGKKISYTENSESTEVTEEMQKENEEYIQAFKNNIDLDKYFEQLVKYEDSMGYTCLAVLFSILAVIDFFVFIALFMYWLSI